MELPRVRRPPAVVVDAVVALLLLAVMAWDIRSASPEPSQAPSGPLTYLLAVGICLPYAFHRRAPLAAVVLTAASVLAYSVAHFAPYPLVSTFVLLWGVAAHADRRRSLTAAVVGMASLVTSLAVQPAGVTDTATWLSTVLAGAAAWLAGENVRQRRARWTALEERASLLEERAASQDREREERARRAVADERLRIARELHDVVAHAMSVVAVQSGMAGLVLDDRPQEARRALAAIETTSRSALTEMRRLLGVLRQEGEPHAALAPAPGLADLPALVAQVRATGRTVELAVEGQVAHVPPAVDLTAYRIVQEALTNVVRYGGAAARVRVVVGADVTVEVTDTGATGVGAAPPPEAVAGGHGLLGIRERVAVFAGRLDAGPLPDGGFRVSATLPLPVGAS